MAEGKYNNIPNTKNLHRSHVDNKEDYKQRGNRENGSGKKYRKDYTSDHYMIGARINFTRLMGKMQIQEDKYIQRKRIVKCAVKASKETYKEIAEERWNTTKMRKLRNQATQLENRAKALGREGNAKQRKKLQKSMDKYMKATTKGSRPL